jgi:hypothetical protein
MKGLTKKIKNNQVLLDYNSDFDPKNSSEPVSFSSHFDLPQYRKKLAGLLKNNFAVLDGIYDKMEIAPNKNGKGYIVTLSTCAKQVSWNSKDPYKDFSL